MNRTITIALLFGACGGDSSMMPDGAAAPDALPSTPDAVTPREATVVVLGEAGATDAGKPRVGVRVLFHRATGELVADTTTDTMGTARATIDSTASLTVVERSGPYTTLRTHAAVEPGDQIKFGTTTLATRPTIATMTVSWPAPPSDVFSRFDIRTPCGAGNVASTVRSVVLTIDDRCAGKTFPLRVFALSNSGYHVQYQMGVPAQTAIDRGTVTLSGAWEGPTIVIKTLSNVPAATNVRGGIGQTIDDVQFVGAGDSAFAPDDRELRYRLGALPTSQIEESILVGRNQRIDARRPFSVATTNLDIGAALIAVVDGVGYDVTTRTMTWTATGTPGDAVSLYKFHARGVQSFSWQVFAPATIGASYTYPLLPADLQPLAPVATDTIRIMVSLVKVGGVPFADARTTLGAWVSTLSGGGHSVDWDVAPAGLTTATISDLEATLVP